MAKIEDITTFNLDEKTYSVDAISPEAKELLKAYLQTEDDIAKNRMTGVQLQHALVSMGNMFREMIKTVDPVAAAEALIAANEPVRPRKPARTKK